MLANLKNYFYPKTVEEAISLLKQPNSKVIAGGTALSLIHDSTIETLIDLENLNLSYIQEDDNNFIIGAMTSAYDIAFYENLPMSIRNCARSIGDIPLLHAVTLGGNIADLYPWNDLPPMLWAMNPIIRFFDSDKSELQELTADEFFQLSKKQNFSMRKAIIIEIMLKKPPYNSYSQFQKFTLTKVGKSQVNLASNFIWDEIGNLVNARLVVSALTKSVERLNEIEQMIINQKLSPDLIHKCLEEIGTNIKIIPNFKSSKEYRRQILRVYLKRTLNSCSDQISRSSGG
ncbi:MAG: FAD binding domain-containing protein [Candidatus Hodarchaeales archaeon]